MKQKAIIIDIDGVLANSGSYIHKHLRHTKNKDYDSFWESIPDHPVNKWAKNLCNNYHTLDYDILMLTARQDTEVARFNTLEWFIDNDIHCDGLFMQTPRTEGEKNLLYDHGKVKIEMYEQLIKPRFDVEFMVDDSPANVSLFRDYGMTVLQPNNYWDKK